MVPSLTGVLTVDWKEWEVGSEEGDSDDSGGWIDVSSDNDHGIEVSDSEDEAPPRPNPEVTASALATTQVPVISRLINARSSLRVISQNSKNSAQKQSSRARSKSTKKPKSSPSSVPANADGNSNPPRMNTSTQA
jgi:hypothetical protein